MVEREQLIGHARQENCDIHTLSMDVRDCIRYSRAKTLHTSALYQQMCNR